MANLYLTEQGSVLRKTGDRLVVEKDGTELLEVECFKIDAVFAFGGVNVTTPALAELLEHGIQLNLLSRDGRLKGRLVPPMAKNVLLRVAQYERHQDQTFCLELARSHVMAKVSSGAHLLARHRRNHPETGMAEVIRRLKAHESKVQSARSLEQLLGYEGGATRVYFEGMRLACRKRLDFPGRRRRPPTDPVNALLSLGYVMLSTEIQALLEGTGFDPYVGFYHRLDYGRPSLALDLLEEFRVVVDQLVLRLVNLEMLKSDDFEPATGGVEEADASAETAGIRLKQGSFRRFLGAYGEHLEGTITDGSDGSSSAIRKMLRRQVERLAAHVMNGKAYEPCVVRP